MQKFIMSSAKLSDTFMTNKFRLTRQQHIPASISIS